jgi:hypothetical protein
MKISPLTVDYQCRFFGLFDRNPEISHRVDCALAIFAWKETTDDAGTIRNCGEQNRAMRHTLIPRNSNFRLDRWRPKNR